MGAISLQLLLALVSVAFLFASVVVYGGTLSRIVNRGGRVASHHFALADLCCASMLAVFFIALMAQVLTRPAGPAKLVNVNQVLPDQLMALVLVVGIASFLHYRNVNLRDVFGFTNLPAAATLASALIFMLAALPAVTITNQLTAVMLRARAPEQPLVELFRSLVAGHRIDGIAQIFFAAVIVAPVCEEFLFRGYFYGVGKRYIGTLASALGTSLLFAAFHLHLASLPGLFVLALCLTAAYERSGSILVPIGMHSLYNFSSLLLLYFDTRSRLGAAES